MRTEEDAIQASLTRVIEKWIRKVAQESDWDVGYCYPDQASDMARAATAVLCGSARGQHFYEHEES